MTDLPELPAIALGRYRHYKGGEYEVLGIVRHSETLAPMVLYRPLYNASGLWVRPHAMFLEQVEVGGAAVPRFARIAGAPIAPGQASPSLDAARMPASPQECGERAACRP